MDNNIFKKEMFTYEDILKAVKYGVNYEVDASEEVWSIPEGNVQQWLSSTKLRTSDEWQKLNSSIVVIDPDGWDRKNHKKNWYEELITYQEYVQRRELSTCMFKKEKDEKE